MKNKETFNQSKYIQNWKKEHKKQFKVDLNIDEYSELDQMLKTLKIEKASFLRKAIKNFKDIQISYECTQIIDDINTAIAFKNEKADCYLIYKKIDGYIIFTDFELDDDFELGQDEFKIKTTLKDALEIFKAQNKLI